MDNKIDYNYFLLYKVVFKKYIIVKFVLEIQVDYLIVEIIQYCY